jgi:transcriptional regulator with XRE-family HTH domain
VNDVDIGERIRELRTLMGWSQRDLAEIAATNPDTVSNIEAGRHKPRPSTLRKIAGALQVEVADFYKVAALPKGEALRPGRGEKRLETLQGYEESIRNVAHKLREEFLELEGSGDQGALFTLYMTTVSAIAGFDTMIEEDEDAQDHVDETLEEMQAEKRLWRSLTRLTDLAGDIEKEIDALEEGHGNITHINNDLRKKVTNIADYMRRKVG